MFTIPLHTEKKSKTFLFQTCIHSNQLRSTLKLDFDSFFVCPHVRRTISNRIVFLSSSLDSYASIVSSKKKGLLSLFSLSSSSSSSMQRKRAERKKGNENALSTYTSRLHFTSICFARESTDREEKMRRGSKNKEQPLKSKGAHTRMLDDERNTR